MIIDSDIYTTHARSFGAGLAGVLSLQKAATAALPIHINLRPFPYHWPSRHCHLCPLLTLLDLPISFDHDSSYRTFV